MDIEKVSRKDKPTFLLRADDGLHKIPSSSVNENFPEGIKSEIERLSSTKLIWSIKDLSDALKVNNTKLDSLTIVYVHDEATYNDSNVALRLLRHESTHQILELRDPELAKQLKMEKGHFYGYCKPSYINGYE